MHKNIYLLLILWAVSTQCLFAQAFSLQSPDGRYRVELKAGTSLANPLQYDLWAGSAQIAANGNIKLLLRDETIRLRQNTRQRKRSSWINRFGEKRVVPEVYNQYCLEFDSPSDTQLKLTVLVRLYNEGFAFQYIVKRAGEIVLEDERSAFGISPDKTVWASAHAQGPITAQLLRDIKNEVERPLTIRIHDSLYVALGEAGLVDYARMKFRFDAVAGLTADLEGATRANNELKSPWRYVLIGNSPGQLLERNYLLLNLNEPTPLKDLSWIRPGKVLREVSLTTEGSFRTIDFAARHSIGYIMFDAGWYGREDHDSSDATKVSLDPHRGKGTLDLQKVINYGRKKGVGVILYVNRRGLERQLDTLLPLYQKWGIKGIKFGFVQVGTQKWTNWVHEAVRKCAKYKMLVDIHDEYRPTGYSRTYPNLLTQEGIRGDEESPVTEHSIVTLFTRMIAGAADNTNVFFTERVDKMGSHTAQMAKALCIFSPLNFLYWYDRPRADSSRPYRDAELQELPELAWYDQLPDTWDETRVLESDMEQYATLVRRKGADWYLGSLNGPHPREMRIKTDFLKKGKKYSIVIYTHDKNIPSATHVQITRSTIQAGDPLTLSVGGRDGVVIYFQKNNL